MVKHLRTYIGLLPANSDGRKVSPRLNSVSLGWLDSVMILQSLSHEVLYTEAGLDAIL